MFCSRRWVLVVDLLRQSRRSVDCPRERQDSRICGTRRIGRKRSPVAHTNARRGASALFGRRWRGALLAWLLLKVLQRLPLQLPGLETIGLNAPALAFALALMIVALLAGMLPARLASRAHLATTMQQGRAVTGAGSIRNALVAAQIAVTLALVFAGGLPRAWSRSFG